MCTHRNITPIKAGIRCSQILTDSNYTEIVCKAIWERACGCQMQAKSILLSGKNNNDWLDVWGPKINLEWAAPVPLVVPLDAAWLSHNILLKSKRLLAFMLIVLLTLFSVSEEVIWATAEVVNLGVFRYQQKKSNLTIAYPEDQTRSSSLSMKCQISPCSCPTQFHFMKLHWHQPNRLCAP